jgi:malate synthase
MVIMKKTRKARAAKTKKRAKTAARTAKKVVRAKPAKHAKAPAKKKMPARKKISVSTRRAAKVARRRVTSALRTTSARKRAKGAKAAPAPRRRPLKAIAPRRGGPRQRPAVAKRPTVAGVVIRGAMGPRYEDILTRPALAFVADLHRKFDGTRKRLLSLRAAQQKRYDAGALPDFLAETKDIREHDWRVAPIPADLQDRRVEITGPVDRKMVINALNSGANVYMADFEDANSPTWDNNVEGQINLKDRWDDALEFTDPETGKDYALESDPAVLIVRPRGWHLPEVHLTVDGEPIAGALFDFGLYFFHNAQAQIEHGTGPYFYLPKLESHLEARLWNDVFVLAETALGLPLGTIKATVLIETLPAAFEMEEILYELRNHIAGLNAGRWDYIFSFIKKLQSHPDDVLPDRDQVVMGKAFLGAYAALLVRTCHRRGAFAMGGMAAQIPVKGDEAANEAAFAKVRADKEREVNEGYDGTWVAHPALVPVAKEVFDRLMPRPNQLDRWSEEPKITRDDLLKVHEGTKTEEGFRHNIRVGVQYIEAWLGGRGAVPIYNLMEDAATAEISRAQIWQWLKYGAVLEDGTKVTPVLFARALQEEMARVKREIGAATYDNGRFPEAIKLFRDISLSDTFVEFLTIPAYKLIA